MTGLGAPRTRPKPFSAVGSGGTVIYGGIVQANEKDSRLLGTERYRTFSELLANVSIVSAGVRAFVGLASKPAWRAKPKDASAEAERLAVLVQEILEGMTTPWHRVVRRAVLHRFYGFSIAEWTAMRRPDGVVGMLDIEARPQVTIERWDVDESGTLQGVVQRNPTSGAEHYLPRGKLLYMLDDALSDSPEGLGLFRHCVRAGKELERLEQLEGWGYETDLHGIPIGRMPMAEMQAMVDSGDPSFTAATRAATEAPMRRFITDHIKTPQMGLLLDSMTYQTIDEHGSPSSVRKWDVEMLKSEGSNLGGVHTAIVRKTTEIARVLQVEHLLLGSTGEGSHALARDKSHGFALLVDGALKEAKETVESDILWPLAHLNGWDEMLMPELEIETVQWRDVEQITGGLRDLAQAGAVLSPDDPVIQEVRSLVGLSSPVVVNDAADESDLALTGTKPSTDNNPDGAVDDEAAVPGVEDDGL